MSLILPHVVFSSQNLTLTVRSDTMALVLPLRGTCLIQRSFHIQRYYFDSVISLMIVLNLKHGILRIFNRLQGCECPSWQKNPPIPKV